MNRRLLIELSAVLCFFVSICPGAGAIAAEAAEGHVRLRARDGGRPVAARLHVRDSNGRPVRLAGVPWWHDHGVFDGQVTLTLPAGDYAYEVERGPEYQSSRGSLKVAAGETTTEQVSLQRLVDLAAEGWWSGDLHIHRALKDIELLMRAEDLHVAPVITWWNNRNLWQPGALPANPVHRFDGNRFYDVMAGEDERGGGAVMFFQLKKPLPLQGAAREYPSAVAFIEQARKRPRVHVDAEKPFWWDVPVWVATGMVDTIGIAHNHMNRDGVLGNEAWGRARDPQKYSGPHGNGLWSQHIYYQILNCGLRIPPSAGSASGVLPNPVGYDRVYVHCGDRLDDDTWWKNLRAGRSFVTNGPLLRVTVNGQLPGHVFEGKAGSTIVLRPNIVLDSRDPVRSVQVIRDGQVVWKATGDPWNQRGKTVGKITFDRSGWLMVRVIADVDKTFRFASTAPFYVEVGGRRRISRRSAQFFVDWVRQRMGQIHLDDPQQREAVLKYHRQAAKFWQDLVDQANAA